MRVNWGRGASAVIWAVVYGGPLLVLVGGCVLMLWRVLSLRRRPILEQQRAMVRPALMLTFLRGGGGMHAD